MAVIAGIAWQGLDAMARSRETAQSTAQATLRTGTALAQWEHDLWAVLPTGVVPTIRFEGAQLRLTRQAPGGGAQVVVWSLREGAWWRWASPEVTRTGELQEIWLRSQQLVGQEPGTLKVLDGVSGLQLYFHRTTPGRTPNPRGTEQPSWPGSARPKPPPGQPPAPPAPFHPAWRSVCPMPCDWC